jgi:nitrile hydratase subunit alpha
MSMSAAEKIQPVSGLSKHSDEELAARAKAMESILVEKGIIGSDAIDYMSSVYENEVGPRIGARVVARAWTDPEFRSRLLEDATKAARELGFGGMQGEEMIALEDTETVHHLVVCTLCSCYPWPILGLPPNWYKYPAYRSRAVRDPRGVMREFGLDVPESVEVRVWDSSAELRYFVLPRRPEGTEGWTEEQLAALVTRDSMIGVGGTGRPGA